jgi:hypothetical protein
MHDPDNLKNRATLAPMTEAQGTAINERLSAVLSLLFWMGAAIVGLLALVLAKVW